MNNEEIRYRILKVLYDRYYNVKPECYVPFLEVIGEGELENEDENVLEANIEYLKNGYYLETLGRFSQPPSFALQLKFSGIDFVEDRNSEYRDYHGKLRFKILAGLYEFYFDGNSKRHADTISLMDDITTDQTEKKFLLAETLYMGDRGYIKPFRISGYYYPPAIMIDNYGIDVVESIFEQSIESLEDAQIDSESQSELLQIKNESDRKTKSKRFREFLSRHESSATNIIVESVKAIINACLSGGG